MIKDNWSLKRISLLLLFVFVLLFITSVMGLGYTILALSIVLVLIVSLHTALKLSATLRPESKILFRPDKNFQPFVSIHIACKSEPAEIVINTIKALKNLDYANYEVIIINSNNHKIANWAKIQEYVKECGENFIFVHLDKVPGFKAGALNYINNNNYMNKTAEVVTIVDSDYIVTPDFLSQTVGYFKNPKVGIVQAPQDYYNVNRHNIGLLYEYRSFFTLVMNQSQRFNLVNFTGTMGLIRASLLINENLKWNEWCITEDTEAGTHINSIGYRGVYIDKSLGKGLMPFSYTSLVNQRQRWVYGNTQIIWKDLYYVMTNKAFSIKQKISFIAQLVTWFHFELLIALLFLGLNIAIASGITDFYLLTAGNLLAGSILVSVFGNLAYFMIGMRKETSLINRLKAFIAHYGLIYTMSSGWLIYLIGYELEFKVTNKKTRRSKTQLRQLVREAMTSLMLLIAMCLGIYSNSFTTFYYIAVITFLIAELSGIIYLNGSLTESKGGQKQS